jgi:molybdopterin adenylyltransferase
MAITVGILIVSDRCSRGEAEDRTTPVICDWATQKLGAEVKLHGVIPDDRDVISGKLISWSDEHGMDLIITSGGTGFALRDVTPEATLEAVQRQVPGLAEAMRQEGMKKTPHAMLSRGIAGIRGKTLVVNLPGSPKAVREGLDVILPALPHGIETLKGEHGANQRHEYKGQQGAARRE